MPGHLLVSHEDVFALSQDDMFMAWRPGSAGRFVTIAHPTPQSQAPDLSPVTMFGGYPMPMSSRGPVLADDQIHPFLAVFSDLIRPVWHRDIMSRLGVPALRDDIVYTNVGGPHALDTLVALDARTGATRWTHAPQGFRPEPVELLLRNRDRDMTPQERADFDTALAVARSKGIAVANPTEKVKMIQATPVINAPHGHWTNPGVVVAGDLVFAQVGAKIVAVQKENGAEIWRFDLNGELARSIAASKEHLFVSLPGRLIALTLTDGKQEWSHETPRAGTLSIAHGRVILAMGPNPSDPHGGSVLAFGSAEPPSDGKPSVEPRRPW